MSVSPVAAADAKKDDGDDNRARTSSDMDDGLLGGLTDEWQTALPEPLPAPPHDLDSTNSASNLLPQLAYTSPRDPALRISLLLTPARGIAFQLWPAALLLCDYIDSPAVSASLRGSTVIELGAGCGLVGMVAAALGAHVTLTDLPDVEQHLQLNIAANPHLFRPQPQPPQPSPASSTHSTPTPATTTYTSSTGGSITTAPLSWGQPTPLQPPNYLLLSDCLYWQHLFPPLLATLTALTAPHTAILLAQTPRRNGVERRFFRTGRRWLGWVERVRGKADEGDRQWMVVLEGRRRDGKEMVAGKMTDAPTPYDASGAHNTLDEVR